MPGIAVAEGMANRIQFSIEKGNKAIRTSAFTQKMIQPGHHLGDRQLQFHQGDQRGAQRGHQQRSGNAFSGNIPNGDTYPSGRERNEIIVIPADTVGRGGKTGQFVSGYGRRRLRKETGLNIAGQGQFLVHALLFHGRFQKPCILDLDGGNVGQRG